MVWRWQRSNRNNPDTDHVRFCFLEENWKYQIFVWTEDLDQINNNGCPSLPKMTVLYIFELRPVLNRLSCGQSDLLGIRSNADDCCIGNCLKSPSSVFGHVHADILAGAALLRLTWPFSIVLAIWFSGLPPPPRYHSRCLFSSYAASRHLWNTIFILHGSFYLGVVPSRTQLLAACYWPSDVQVLPSGEAVTRLLGLQHWLCEHGAVPPGIRSCHLMLRMERRWRSWSLVRVMMCLW